MHDERMLAYRGLSIRQVELKVDFIQDDHLMGSGESFHNLKDDSQNLEAEMTIAQGSLEASAQQSVY